MAEEPLDLGDPKSVKAKRRTAKQVTQRRNATVSQLMATPEGREWFYELLDFCGIYRNPHSVSGPYQTAFNCGETNVGQKVLADLQSACPDLYLKMLEEQTNESSSTDD
jgi:putative methionine-R-sulfoxide reductase with GAF domain